MSPSNGVLLVAGSGHHVYREYGLAAIAERYDVVLVDPAAPTWQRPYAVDHETADVLDPAALRRAAAKLAERHRIAGVLTWNEYALVPVAELAAHLGLPCNSPRSALACRNKAATRAALAEHRVPSAQSVPVATGAEAKEAADKIGYPVVLKPAAYAGSIGVILVESPDELADAYAFAAGTTEGQGAEGTGILVEEYLQGPEISVECVTVGGRSTPVAVTRKRLGFPPFFEETGHTVTAGDPLLEQAAPVALAALKALGVTTGVSHVELRLTSDGPRVIEVNGRLGGDLIPHLVRLATGVDLPRAAAAAALGEEPDLAPTHDRTAAISLLYPEVTGRVTALDDAPARDLRAEDWLERLVWEREVGDRVVLPPEGSGDTARVGHIVVTGEDEPHCLSLLTQTETLLTVTVEADAEKRAGA